MAQQSEPQRTTKNDPPRMSTSDFVELLCDFLDSDTHTYEVAEPRSAFADCMMDWMGLEEDVLLTEQERDNLDTAARVVRTCLADFPLKWREASADE